MGSAGGVWAVDAKVILRYLVQDDAVLAAKANGDHGERRAGGSHSRLRSGDAW